MPKTMAPCALLLLAAATLAQAQVPVLTDVHSIDPYPDDPAPGWRVIPDVASGGERELAADEVIDWVILGDGYLDTEEAAFLTGARDAYHALFGCETPCTFPVGDLNCGLGGVEPYQRFREAFRVRAVFHASDGHCSESDRDASYYRVKIETGPSGGLRVVSDGWWNAGGADDEHFRDRLHASLVELDVRGPAHNPRAYPSDLDVTSSGDTRPIIHHELKSAYSHLVVTMLVNPSVSGITRMVTEGLDPNVVVAFGDNRQHEFQHAFALVEDEYVSARGVNADRHDPLESERSIFKLSNLTYSDERCEAPWSHLGPGGRYNRDRFSLIGNLYRGGEQDDGVWHSDYTCLMNDAGNHESYECTLTGGSANLRDRCRLCFRCEEIATLRILEKTGQLACSSATPDWNACGRDSLALWEATLRDRWAQQVDLRERIAARGACYAGDPAHAGDCSGTFPCLAGCPIRDHGAAIHVDASSVALFPDGSRLNAFRDPVLASGQACSRTRLIAIVDGVGADDRSYPGPYRFTSPAVLGARDCVPAVLGR